MNRRQGLSGDAGVFAILYALVVVALCMTAALVVDLSGMREDRRVERLAADAAATGGAIKLNTLAGAADAQAACTQAWEFLRVNLSSSSSPAAMPAGACPPGKFPPVVNTCPTAQPQTTTYGDWTVTMTWPVTDDSPYLQHPNVTGGSQTQALDTAVDGTDPCGRLAVSVSRTRPFLLAGAGGFASGSTTNTSVARADVKGDIKEEFPLVVLDQHGCDILHAQGSGPQDGTIRVLNNGLTPGRIASDSAGDAAGNSGHGCANSNAYIATAGGGGRIQALNGTGGASGLFLTFATVGKTAAPGSLIASCPTPPTNAAGGTVCPRPITHAQITRKFWDWQYHCTTATTAPLSAPCPNTATTPDYIGQLQGSLGTTTAANAAGRGFTVTPATANDSSVCNASGPYKYFPSGNYFINCDTFTISGTTVFGGGQVIFKGGVLIKANGAGAHCAVFNQPVGLTPLPNASGSYDFCSPTSSTVSPAPTGDMIVFIKNGDLSRQNADFIAPQTFFYQEASTALGGCASCRFDLGQGTSSNLLMTGPKAGNFQNLVVWSENTAGVSNNNENQLGSQNKLAIEGILFLPNALVNFGGNPTYLGSARAQFVAWQLSVKGGGTLELTPDPSRTLTIPVGGERLIR
jgi:Flp pilus assembly protein TadG